LWREDLRILTRVVDSLVKTFKLHVGLYDEARKHFSESELIDVTQLTGLYTNVAMMVGLARSEFDRYRLGVMLTTKAV
jgi:hypothetical protein